MPLSNASSVTLRPPSHGSGSGWFATPFLCDSFIHDSMPVYPGAIPINNRPQVVNLPHQVQVMLVQGTV